jgi:hypothetical protein
MLDLEELVPKRQNQPQLVDYLTLCLHDEPFLELCGCWSGDEEEAPTC